MDPAVEQALKSQMNEDINKGLDGATSDHTRRFFQIDFEGETPIRVSVGTWNLMMYAKNINLQGFSNNPFLVEETDQQYYARKYLQINTLIEEIVSKKLDVFFLQEADFMFPHPKDPQGMALQKQALKMQLTLLLNALGYGIRVTQITQSGSSGLQFQQPLVTLYNMKSFQPVLGQADIGGLPNDRSLYRCSKSYFIHTSGKKIVLMNAHLDYMMDYSSSDRLQTALTADSAAGIFLIGGGDMNHHPGASMPYLITDKRASTVSAVTYISTSGLDYVRTADRKTILTTTHARTQSPMACDGIFITPIIGYRAKVTFLGGEYIQLDSQNNTAKFMPLPVNANAKNRYSCYGQPYQNEKYRILEVEKTLGTSKEDANFNLVTQLLNVRTARKEKEPTKLKKMLPRYTALTLPNPTPYITQLLRTPPPSASRIAPINDHSAQRKILLLIQKQNVQATQLEVQFDPINRPILRVHFAKMDEAMAFARSVGSQVATKSRVPVVPIHQHQANVQLFKWSGELLQKNRNHSLYDQLVREHEQKFPMKNRMAHK